MGTSIQAEWQPTQFQFPSTPLTMFSLPNPTAGVEAYRDWMDEQTFRLRQSEIPARAEFLLGCVESDLVSESTLERLTESQSLVSMERAICEAIANFGPQVRIGRKPFTKSAKRSLRDIEVPLAVLLPVSDAAMLAEAVLMADWLEPNHALARISQGDEGVKLLANEAVAAMRQRLPNGFTVDVAGEGLLLSCDAYQAIKLHLPTGQNDEAHALRMAVVHALYAVSHGIAWFNDPQSMLGIDERYLWGYSEMWKYFKPLLAGKTAAHEIAEVLEATNPEQWEFEVYAFGVDDPSEIEPGSDAFVQMVGVLSEIAQFERDFAIDASGYWDQQGDFLGTCTQQVELLRGQAMSYPRQAKVYEVLIESISRAAEFKSSGTDLAAILELSKQDDEGFEENECGPIMSGLFVVPCNSFSTLREEVDGQIENDFNNLGLPYIEMKLNPGVVACQVIPIIEAITEAYRLVNLIAATLEEAGYVGDEY